MKRDLISGIRKLVLIVIFYFAPFPVYANAPDISDINVPDINASSAIVTWHTNKISNCMLRYATSYQPWDLIGNEVRTDMGDYRIAVPAVQPHKKTWLRQEGNFRALRYG